MVSPVASKSLDVEAKTAAYTIRADEIGKCFTNAGATGPSSERGLTLPPAAAGLHYRFVITDSSGLTINAQGDDTIRTEGKISLAAGSVDSNEVGASLLLVATSASAWIATSIARSWTLLNEKSCTFDGVNERASIGNVSALDFERTDPFSISLFFKTSALTDQAPFSKRSSTALAPGYAIRFRPGPLDLKFVVFLCNNDNINEIQKFFTVGLNEFNDGAWHHLAMTYSGSSTAAGVKLYLDNVLKAGTVDFDSLTASMKTTAAAVIGASANGTGDFWNGLLDEVSVWSKELSSAEVSEIYNGKKPTNLVEHSAAVKLVGWWRMGDGDTFPTLEDNSVNNNGATMTNMEATDIVLDVP